MVIGPATFTRLSIHTVDVFVGLPMVRELTVLKSIMEVLSKLEKLFTPSCGKNVHEPVVAKFTIPVLIKNTLLPLQIILAFELVTAGVMPRIGVELALLPNCCTRELGSTLPNAVVTGPTGAVVMMMSPVPESN